MLKTLTILTVKKSKRLFPRHLLREPREVYQFVKESADLDREYVFRLDLDTRNYSTGMEIISIGTLNSTLVHPREFWKGALLRNASAVVVLHNHPSGNTEPSPEDVTLTRRLFVAGKILGIDLLDHLIIGPNGYYSFKEHGCMPKKENENQEEYDG